MKRAMAKKTVDCMMGIVTGSMIALMVYAGLLTNIKTAHSAEPDLKIGWTTWDDAEVVSKLIFTAMVERGYDVELTLADIDVQYRNVAEGNLDAMFMAWLPNLHGEKIKRFGSRDQNGDGVPDEDYGLIEAGMIYGPARVGLAVNEHVPDTIKTLEDLRGNADLFEGKIIGIDPNAGLTRLTKDVIDVYGLSGYSLTEDSTGPKMARDMSRATRRGEPAVATVWNPHYVFAENNLRYLEDPQNVYGEPDSIYIMAHRRLPETKPEMYHILSQISVMPIAELEEMMLMAYNESVEVAVDKWITENQDVVDSWFK